ncbi:MAG: hypothetical protein RDU89_08860 [bacterium]|nr:hypothetical protein [bacterium]
MSKKPFLWAAAGGTIVTGVWVGLGRLVLGDISWGPALAGGVAFFVTALILFSRKERTGKTDAGRD